MDSPLPQKTFAVANWFINKGLMARRPVCLPNLQKLIYFAHGYSLALFDNQLINEKIEAYKWGIMVPNDFVAPILDDPSNKIQALLDIIWTVFGNCSPQEMSAFVVAENGPWKITWSQNPERRLASIDISDQDIKTYFLKLANSKAIV